LSIEKCFIVIASSYAFVPAHLGKLSCHWYYKSEFFNHSQTFIPYLDISISSRDLCQKKLVLTSSESWCDNQLSHQESSHRRDSSDNCPRLDS